MLTKTDLKHFQQVLETRRAGLEAFLRNREVIAVDSNADLFDQIQHATERDVAVGSLERESECLREVRAALRRIHLGTFGTCLNCDGEIGLKRLAAVPWTSSCIGCQEAAEDSRKASGIAA